MNFVGIADSTLIGVMSMIKCILLILAALPFLGNAQPREPEYIVIESDYEGAVMLDIEMGARYLKTDEGIYRLEDM